MASALSIPLSEDLIAETKMRRELRDKKDSRTKGLFITAKCYDKAKHRGKKLTAYAEGCSARYESESESNLFEGNLRIDESNEIVSQLVP